MAANAAVSAEQKTEVAFSSIDDLIGVPGMLALHIYRSLAHTAIQINYHKKALRL